MERKGRKIGPEIHCADLKLSRNLSAHVRKSGVDEVNDDAWLDHTVSV